AALELKADPSRLLATVQIGVTLIAVLSGTFGQATLGERLESAIQTHPGFLGNYAHPISMAIVVIGISYFSLILGELVPKRIALLFPERIAAVLARVMRLIARAAAPIEWSLSASSDLILRLLPLPSKARARFRDEETRFRVGGGVPPAHTPQGERASGERARGLGDGGTTTVTTPRPKIEWLDLEDPKKKNRRKIRESTHSRFPVV